jgi:dihydroorotate dehydrogenase (fumarate)
MADMPPRLPKIDPPLLNSATPWATTIDDLRHLYNCPDTGAITIRTSLLQGFAHDPSVHQYAFFSPSTGAATTFADGRAAVLPDETSSLNTLGYSPIPLPQYLAWLAAAADVARCHALITRAARDTGLSLAMEINLSCPNIPHAPPPAYDPAQLLQYLGALAAADGDGDGDAVPCGIKTPPYTHAGQFAALLSALASDALAGPCPISFITATNTLGSCLILRDDDDNTGVLAPVLRSAAGDGIGGMAGAALHPLALGNVATLRRLLDAQPRLAHIAIIGVGGVADAAGFARMRCVGAVAVGVGTAVGREGVDVFRRIRGRLED